MSNHDCLIELDALLKEDILWLEVEFFASILHLSEELGIVLFWKLDAWEQVTCDTLVKRDIIRCELWNVNIVQSFQADQVLWPVWKKSSLAGSSGL